jgi:uncharacterized protein
MISSSPSVTHYKPKGIPFSELEEVVLTLDEFEAIKLADYQSLYQEQAAEAMHISRQTFGRIIESAHQKIAAAFIQGAAIRIEGGVVAVRQKKETICGQCRRPVRAAKSGAGRRCPHCTHHHST